MCLCAVVQLSHPAYHFQVLAGEQPRGQEDRALRAARGSHHQHGRDGAVRGRGRHLHRPSEQLRAGLWADHYHKVQTTDFTCRGLLACIESWKQLSWKGPIRAIILTSRRHNSCMQQEQNSSLLLSEDVSLTEVSFPSNTEIRDCSGRNCSGPVQ